MNGEWDMTKIKNGDFTIDDNGKVHITAREALRFKLQEFNALIEKADRECRQLTPDEIKTIAAHMGNFCI
jgi:hypothetical protein